MNNIKNLSPKDFYEVIKGDTNITILDVRTPEETAEGIIKNAQIINFFSSDFSEKINALDKQKNYYIYCRSGNRSMQACNKMSAMGFENLCNLDGGMMAWEINDLPLSKM